MSKKTPSAADIRDLALDLLSALEKNGNRDGVVTRLDDESASTRLEVFDAAIKQRRERRQVLCPEAVESVLPHFVDPGPNCKAEFAGRYLVKVFQGASLAPAEGRSPVLRALIRAFLHHFGDADGKRSLSPVALQALGDSADFLRALETALLDPDTCEELAKAWPGWSLIVPEIASRSKIDSAAANALIEIIRSKEPLAAAIRLSLPPLQRAANKEDTLPSPPTVISGASPGPPKYQLEGIEQLELLLIQQLRALDADVSKRTGTLSDRCVRLEQDATQLRADAAALRDELRAAQSHSSSLSLTVRDLREQASVQASALATANSRIAEYQRSWDALADGAEKRVVDQVAATKRSFADRQLSSLRSLRDYLERLRAVPNAETASLAIVNFNRLIKFLHTDGYLRQSEISTIASAEADAS